MAKASKAFSRIRELPEDKRGFIRDWLVGGKEIMALTRYIQTQWNLWNDIAETTLFQQLSRYKKYMLAETDMAVVEKNGQITVKGANVKGINVEERLCALITIQEHRLEGFLANESKMKLPMAAIDKVVDTTKDLLVALQKLRFDNGTDQYYGTSGNKLGLRTMLPDGTVIEAVAQNQQVENATRKALEVLSNYAPNDNASAEETE